MGHLQTQHTEKFTIWKLSAFKTSPSMHPSESLHHALIPPSKMRGHQRALTYMHNDQRHRTESGRFWESQRNVTQSHQGQEGNPRQRHLGQDTRVRLHVIPHS